MANEASLPFAANSKSRTLPCPATPLASLWDALRSFTCVLFEEPSGSNLPEGAVCSAVFDTASRASQGEKVHPIISETQANEHLQQELLHSF